MYIRTVSRPFDGSFSDLNDGRLRHRLQAPLRQRRGLSTTRWAAIPTDQSQYNTLELIRVPFRASTPGERAVQILYEPFHFSAILLEGMFLTGTSGHATDYASYPKWVLSAFSPCHLIAIPRARSWAQSFVAFSRPQYLSSRYDEYWTSEFLAFHVRVRHSTFLHRCPGISATVHAPRDIRHWSGDCWFTHPAPTTQRAPLHVACISQPPDDRRI